MEDQQNVKFKKGVSGNPTGRPIGSFSLVAILKNKLQEFPKGKDKETYAHLLIKKMLAKAIKNGDSIMIKDIINRIDGMPAQKFGLEDSLITDLKINIIRTKKDVEKFERNDSLRESDGGVGNEKKQDSDIAGGDGELKNNIAGPTDGNDNAVGKK